MADHLDALLNRCNNVRLKIPIVKSETSHAQNNLHSLEIFSGTHTGWLIGRIMASATVILRNLLKLLFPASHAAIGITIRLAVGGVCLASPGNF